MLQFADFYRETQPRLIASLAALCGDLDLAVDAADEAAARTLERWPKVAAMDNPHGYLFKVGANELKRRGRRRSIERVALRRRVQPQPVPGPAGEIWLLVAELAPRQRHAIVLRYVGQLTEPEIATVMGITRGTVSATLRTATQRLRESLDDPALVEFELIDPTTTASEEIQP